METRMVSDDPIERALRQRFDAHDLDGTLTHALEAYGSELYGYLCGLARDRAQADDAFGQTCERMWKGLPTFRWDSALRVWAYRIAHNEFLRTTRATARARREVPLSQVKSVQQAIARARSETATYDRTPVKERFAELRATLDPDDHALLGLRLDRKLAWTEIAKVLGNDEPSPREVAVLRKRFERLKTRLRAAVKAG
jgi:RNA polymerase sigma factor (sigma-70 family)